MSSIPTHVIDHLPLVLSYSHTILITLAVLTLLSAHSHSPISLTFIYTLTAIEHRNRSIAFPFHAPFSCCQPGCSLPNSPALPLPLLSLSLSSSHSHSPITFVAASQPVTTPSKNGNIRPKGRCDISIPYIIHFAP